MEKKTHHKWLVVDEDDNGKLRLERVKVDPRTERIKFIMAIDP